MFKNIIVTLLFGLFSNTLLATQLTVDNYKKSERQLSKFTKKLVTGTVEAPFWQNEQLFYKSHTKKGYQFFKVSPVTQQKTLAFDHNKLAQSIAVIIDDKVNAYSLPFTYFKLTSKDKITFTLKSKSYSCNLKNYLCMLAPKAKKLNEIVSPNGKLAVFIRDYNLWSRNLESDKEVQLTTDGIKHFGYATNNAGWIRKDTPVVKWSPDSTKLTTFKHDSRNVGDMALVSTNVGHPTID